VFFRRKGKCYVKKETPGRMSHDSRGREKYAAASQEMPKISGHHQKLDETNKDSPHKFQSSMGLGI
jgi:hypothetical protein